MKARRRTTIILALVALTVFMARWPLDAYLCDPTRNAACPKANEGQDFFHAVFNGGGGSPAVLAMMGGQRSAIAGILWQYTDVLFHEGKTREMVPAFEGCVTLNPNFLEAWSVYGWHLAWNLYIYTDNPTLRDKWMRMGEDVFKRAREANPTKPMPYFDLAWFYTQRKGDYAAAMPYLEEVVYGQENGAPRFTMVPTVEREKLSDVQRELRWEPQKIGRYMALIYLKRGVVASGNAQELRDAAKQDPARAAGYLKDAAMLETRMSLYMGKATKCYTDVVLPDILQQLEQARKDVAEAKNPDDKAAKKLKDKVRIVEDDLKWARGKIAETSASPVDPKWLKEQYELEIGHNRVYGLPSPQEPLEDTPKTP